MPTTTATHSTQSTGLGSLQGIRWLLAVGALVLAVSVYRLVEAQWAGMPVTAQFLTLVFGSFTLFGAGELLEKRLRLPIAGSALKLLFSVLVPVLSWGAAYLDLLSAPWGAIVYGGSLLALLSAFRRCLREELRYHGLLYPITFSLLTVSFPLLSRLSLTGWGYIFAAISLGGVLLVGSQHINRFLFHRDRRAANGCVDSPVQVLPFVALTVLYAASLRVLSLPVSYVALPLLILGAALVTTGEEYFHALVRSLRARPSAWPRRSAGFLAVGFALMAIAGPFAFLDASGRVPAIVFCGIAALLFRWSYRYENTPAHVVAMCASVLGYVFLPTLMPQVAVETVVSLTDVLGLVAPAAKLSFGQLGLALLFTALARRYRGGRAHAMCASVHLIAIVALSGFAGVKIVAPLALALALLSVFIAGRREWLIPAHVALGATILAWAGAYGMELLAVVMIAIVSLSRGSRYLTWPAFFWAGVIGISGVVSFTGGGALELIFAGVLLLVLGHRLELVPVIVAGIGALSLGVHGELAFTYAASTVTIVAVTQVLFAASVVLLRWANSTNSTNLKWAFGAHLSVLGHGALGVLWLFVALVNGSIGVTIEPVILALLGWAILWHGLREHDEHDSAVGLGFLVTYVPLHLAALGIVESVPVLLLIALGWMLVARALAPPLLVPGVERLVRFWRVTAVVAALGFVGIEALALAIIVAFLGALYGKISYRSLLLVLAQGLIWFTGAASYELFPLALGEAIASEFPLFATLVLGWILLVEARGVKPLQLWTTALECFVVSGYFVGEIFTTWDHGAMLVIAAAFAIRHALRSLHHENAGHAWAMQAWLALGVLVGVHAGWVSFGNGRAPYVLLATGVLQYGLAALWKRAERGQLLASTSTLSGQTLALIGGAVALVRLQPWPLFLASVFYLILASSSASARARQRVLPSVLSASFLGLGLFAIASGQAVGLEFYSLAPGFTLVALSLLLSEEMGPRFSRHVFTAGAAFIYTTPVLALYDDITWAWQAVLLLLTVGFGTASFWLRSRPLLTVSTAALVIDLACFVIMIRAAEPLLLWVGGVFLGIAIMTFASYLEYRREGLAQQIRVFGRHLAGWY